MLSPTLTRARLPEIIKVFHENTNIRPKDFDDADTRKHAVNGLETIVMNLGFS